jgi:hypothetical protein
LALRETQGLPDEIRVFFDTLKLLLRRHLEILRATDAQATTGAVLRT